LLGELVLTHLAKNKAYSLSGGERRRVEITRALVTSPRYIFSTSPLPYRSSGCGRYSEDYLEAQSKGIGVVISDHNVRETLSVCDRAYIVNAGKSWWRENRKILRPVKWQGKFISARILLCN
jgi:lipopolysaccharide export system ATP-binding protein